MFFTPGSRFESSRQTRGLASQVNALYKKEKELAAAAARKEQTAIDKHVIIKNLTVAIASSIEFYNKAENENEIKLTLMLLQNLKQIIDVTIDEKAIKTLMIHRNDNQYYANLAYGGGVLLGGLAVATAMPQTFIGTLSMFFGVGESMFSYLHGFDTFIPSSLKTILSLYEKLCYIEHRLRSNNPPIEEKVPTHYEILGLEKNATTAEIKKQYYKLARIHHPDCHGDAAKFAQINEANSILTNDEKRKKYDLEIEAPQRYPSLRR